MFAIAISVTLHYLIFGQGVLIWAIMTPMQVFFLNATLSQQADRKLHMLGFTCFSTIAVGLFSFLAKKALVDDTTPLDALYLSLPVLCLTFFVGMVRAYHLDTYRMFVPVVVNSLVAAVYVDSGIMLPIWQVMFVVFTSALIGTTIGFLLLNNPGNYGKYTQVYYPLVLKYLSNMLKNVDNPHEFTRYKSLTFNLMHNIKQTLHTKSSVYNDNYMIKNIKRAIFYIYRIEDIYMLVTLLPEYKIARDYPSLQSEILYNLNELSRIFAGKIPKLQRKIADSIIFLEFNSQKQDALANIIKILYSKLESFSRVGSNIDTTFNPPAQKSFKNIIKSFKTKDATFKFSVKYSLAIGLSLLIAMLLDINRGIWISMGIVSVVRPSVGGMQKIGKEYVIATFFGIMVGIFLAVFANAIVFYSLFAVLLFFVVYLRGFPFWLWSGFMMCVFVMMYSALYDDFLVYVFDRLIDIGLGVIFGVLIFTKIWPRFSHDNLKPLISKELKGLSGILGILLDFIESKRILRTQEIQASHAELLHSIEELKNTLRDSKAEKKGAQNQIVVYGFELIDIMQSVIIKVNELSLLFGTSFKSQDSINSLDSKDSSKDCIESKTQDSKDSVFLESKSQDSINSLDSKDSSKDCIESKLQDSKDSVFIESKLQDSIPPLDSKKDSIESNAELEINDLKLLQVRFNAINDLINDTTHYFRFNKDALLSDKNTYFYKLISEIFTKQNTLYNLLNENHITALSE
ncbi:FUSC family protein [Helicobacter saguini]|uniref:FUSC family protein n=2 Tax=Helicobacter saguini TaxID=1548018 RepID=A0A347VMH1_9HELI|nr:FUSC family protein [Helicobacter saguini]MWV66205.1 FUSC family protein [Helicobacter saguini]MWV68555.1 FUSC family protein [Helicobacter saguini]MWV71891.1 FUSC family protein [Helicobacter saguini]TLD96001.1 FUSC family protein [Helicobacter saguini]